MTMWTRDDIATKAPERTAEDCTGGRRRLFGRLSDWTESCADYWAASAMYEELSHLSDAELRRRGMARHSLARDICAATDRTITSR
jgi:hypothetical protein